MKIIGKKPLRVLLVVAIVVLVCVFVMTFGPLDPLPRLRASAKSPDGAMTVKVFRQMVKHYPLRVAVFVQIYDDKTLQSTGRRFSKTGGGMKIWVKCTQRFHLTMTTFS